MAILRYKESVNPCARRNDNSLTTLAAARSKALAASYYHCRWQLWRRCQTYEICARIMSPGLQQQTKANAVLPVLRRTTFIKKNHLRAVLVAVHIHRLKPGSGW